jgi:hypothetical protein
MPENTLSQIKGDDRFGTRFDLPRFRQISYKAIQVLVILDQAVEDEGVDLA